MPESRSSLSVVAPQVELSPRQVARALGVGESTLKRWCDQGLLGSRRTAGGHRRVPISSVVELVRRQGYELAQPELIGLPRLVGGRGAKGESLCQGLVEALEGGDAGRVESLIIGSYLEGRPLASTFDELVAPAFEELGRRWESGVLEVYKEHRAVEICSRVLHGLRELITNPPTGAPVAAAASLAGDPYSLPLIMTELVLRDLGWNAQSLGPDHPVGTLVAALHEVGPTLLLLGVGRVQEPVAFVRDYDYLLQHARNARVSVVVGGRAMNAGLRSRVRFTAFCETMTQLVDFAQGLWRPPAPSP